MKTSILTLAAVLTFGLLSHQIAFAGPDTGRGYRYGCGGSESGRASLNQKNYAAREQFYKETREIRKQLYDLQREYAEVLNTEPINKEQAEELWGEMFDLRTEISALAKEQDVFLGGPAYCLGPNGYYEEERSRKNSRSNRGVNRRSGGRRFNI